MLGFAGLTIVSQCCQTGRSTSFSVRQVCDFRSTMYCGQAVVRHGANDFPRVRGIGFGDVAVECGFLGRSGIAHAK